MTEEKSLTVTEEIEKLSVFTTKGMAPVLAKIKKDVQSVVSNVTTLKGREEVKSRAFMVTKVKTKLSAKGLESIETSIKLVKDTKDAIKHSDQFLTDLAKETREPLTRWEADEKIRKEEEVKAEAKRVEDVRAEIGKFNQPVIAAVGKTSEDIQGVIDTMKSQDISEDSFAEFVDSAIMARDSAIRSLETMRGQTKNQEDIAAQAKIDSDKKELEAKAKEKQAEEDADKLKKERLALAKEKEELAKEKEELAAKEAEILEAEKAEREKKEAVEEAERKAAEEAERKEDERLAKEKAERKEAEEKAADKEHRAKVKAESTRFIRGIFGTSGEQADAIFDAISTGEVPHISVKY